jgi:outer membrane usher protein
MPILHYIKKYFWRIILQIIFYSFCVLFIYYFYKWTPEPIRSITIFHHNPPIVRLSPQSAVGENYYQVFINGVDTQKTSLFFKDKHGNLLVSAKDLEQWGLIQPRTLPIKYDDNEYYNLSLFSGLTYIIDAQNLIIKLHVPVELFKANYINANASQINEFILPSPGLFFNYNLLDTRDAGSQPNNLFTGLFQLGLFGPYGVGNTIFVNQNAPDTETWLRYTTAWRYDKPDKMWTLSLGDDVSASTEWTSSVNFGGVQWGTNFGTQPAFITFPQLGFKGQATVPSTVDLYINNTTVSQQNIAPGPYQIYNIPYIDGYGNMRVVTTDFFGQQQVVSFPFYASNQLLKTGLTDYTYEFGFIRQNLGLTSFDYARFIAAATKSVGVNDRFTYQWHIEGLSDQQTVGISAFKELWVLGILNGSVGISHINAGNKDGGLIMGGFQRLTPNYSIGFSSEVTTLYFTQQGVTPGQFSPRLINQAFGGIMLGKNNFSFTYLHEINRENPSTNVISGTVTRNIFFGISLSVSGQTNLSGEENKGVFISLTRSLGENTSGNINNSIQNSSHQESVGVTRSLPQGPGYGYSLIGATGSDVNNKLGSVSYQNDIGTYQGQVVQNNGFTIYSLNVQGAAVYLGGQSYLTRNLNGNSFAVVQTPGFKDVDVYLNNQLTARSDKNGNALIPNLLPYQETAIKIDPNTLPLSANIGETSVVVAPYYSSGIIVPFAVKNVSGVTFILKQASGSLVPEGSVVHVEGQKEEYIVGSGGQAYLANLGSSNKVTVEWEGHHCQMIISIPESNPKNNPILDLGTLTCKEIVFNENQMPS